MIREDPPPGSVEALPCSNGRLLTIVALFPLAFVVAGLSLDSPQAIARGLLAIVGSRDTLITDYMGLGGVGAALVHAGLLTLLAIGVYRWCGAVIGGAAVASLMLVLGFGLFGKSLINVWFIVLGVWLYARFNAEPFAKHVNTAFFGAALAPIFTEIVFSSALPWTLSLPLAALTTLLLGFVLVPVAASLFNAHTGHTLYNIGWVAGVMGTVTVAVYKGYGFVPDPVFIWSRGHNALLSALLFGLFAACAVLGRALDRDAVIKQAYLMRLCGRAPTDFVALAGIGPTLLNMGVCGAIGTAYVLAVGGDLNGPTIGAIFTIVGFAAYGKHPKNIAPVMLGVFVASLTKVWGPADPSVVLAALFGTTLAPIAGRFGWHWGVIAGFVHGAVAQSVGQVHGGLVLYNNGFAAGLVAAVLVPLILALQRPDKPSS